MISATQRKRNQRARDKVSRIDRIAVIDMETDPFDNQSTDDIFPFLAVLYSDDFNPIVIWDDNYSDFIVKIVIAITSLPGKYTIYAHNGGKFDFMFLISKLRGKIMFKGRGIMTARLGAHELRDSYHILPEALANMAKQNFDYTEKLSKKNRDKYREEIISYCISDCKNILFFIKRFLKQYGLKISIGAASIDCLKKHYTVEKITEHTDEKLRAYYFGGRVECITGAGYYSGPLKLYDVNSMYPYAMAKFNHPTGSNYIWRQGLPSSDTYFIRLLCENNCAFLARDEKGLLTSRIKRGEFFVTKFEYEAALDLDLIGDVQILECVDCITSTNFSAFVNPLYNERARLKQELDFIDKEHNDYLNVKSQVLFLKLILNNCYGKFAQNPRRFKEHFISNPGESPEGLWGNMPEYMCADYWLWSKPTDIKRYYNVGTSASITGAARSILMRAIQSALNPLYCDTDSLICQELRGHKLDKFELGAWDLECEISEIVIAGKKLYAYKTLAGKEIVRTKGTSGLTFNQVAAMIYGDSFETRNFGPTLTKRGTQSYISRRVQTTTPINHLALPERRFSWR